MRHLVSVLLIVSAGLGLTLLAAQPTPARGEPDVDVRTIIDRALERATWAQEQHFAARYRYHMSQRTREFDDDGDATVDDRRDYAVAPHRGTPYARLLSKNGEPPSDDDLKEEQERWEDFVESLDRPPDEDEDDEIAMVFDEELIERFTATLDGVEELRGRPSFVLVFEPRPGKLPVRRRTDHALNNSRGKVWIDQATYEISRVDFELIGRVRLWWGILGSVSDAMGHLDRQPVAPDGPWLSSELDVYYHARVLFSTTRRGETTIWDDFELITD